MPEGVFGDDGESEADEEPLAPSLGAGQDAAGVLGTVQAHAGQGPAVERATVGYLNEQTAVLEKQGRMLEIQMEHLHEQRSLNLKHMRTRRWREGLQLAFQGFAALAAAVIGAGVVVMLHDAFTSKAVVVEAFKAPAALAARGLTGDVVAAGVLDQLQKLQDATRATTRQLNARSAWSSDVKIEVPETGVSIGEIDRLLHQRFGHDVHIDGDLVQTDIGGLALTVRGDGVPSKTLVGGAGDLDKLTIQAAEYVYGQAQPFNFATYLIDTGRYNDDLAFLPGAFLRGTDSQRADLANTWGNVYASLFQPVKAIEKYRLAISLRPDNWKSWGNLVGALASGGSEEAAWQESQRMMRAAALAPKDKQPSLINVVNIALIAQDWSTGLASGLQDAAFNRGAGASVTIEGPSIADDYAHLHDPAQAIRYLALSDPDDSLTKAETLLLPAYAALERGDPAAAIPTMEAFWKAWLADPNLQYTYNEQPCMLGLAYGLTGRMAEADAVFRRAGPWAYCFAVHGDVLEHAGDLAGAERIWAEGLRVGPDLSPVYLHRGLSRMKRGDRSGAAADFAMAHLKSSRWADPLKAYGDLYALQRRWDQALARYDEAVKLAPDWAELRAARAAALREAAPRKPRA